MYSIGEINKQNNQTARDENNRKIANYEKQENGDIWTRLEGRLKIIEAGPEADKFLADVKGFNPGQLRVFLEKHYQLVHA
jgi:hypothetical protein